MRRLAAIAVLLATGGTLAGCGKGGEITITTVTRPGTQSTRTGGAGSRPTAPSQPPSQSGRALAAAQAFARAVNLKPADVPGFRVSSERERQPETPAEKRLKPELRRCFGSTGETKALLEASSRKFERSAGLASQSVSSEVTVSRTGAPTAAELKAVHSGRLPACLSHYFDLLLESQHVHGASIGPVTTREGSPPAPGMTGSVGLRFTAAISVRGVKIPFYLDILSFTDGPAEVTLSSFGLPQPFPSALEEQLFSLLVTRARAHKA